MLFIGIYSTNAHSQVRTITGTVLDDKLQPLPHASIVALPSFHGTIANTDGQFSIEVTKTDSMLQVAYLGYENSFIDTKDVTKNNFTIKMKATLQNLQEVVITDQYAEKRKKEESLNMEVVNEDYLKKHLGGSLMKSLEQLPGISTIDIGSGQSKPVIRGLGFNRVVVVENGIKHEGQQWGADHGLEIDQYSSGRVEIIKGPASLLYGADAIGGVVDILPPYLPTKNTWTANFDATTKSNNNSLGSSVNVQRRKEKWYFNLRASAVNYADFVVPANSVHLYEWEVPLQNGAVRNTAGKEFHLNGTVGYVSNKFRNHLYLSRTYFKSGFFANASGLEPLSIDQSLHDSNSRDILNPNQYVRHLKAINRTTFYINKQSKLLLDIAYQNNHREEWMTYSPHAGEPIIFPDSLSFPSYLEKQFNKGIYSGKVLYSFKSSDRLQLKFGIS